MERYLIRHCAPTLASLKTASLFRLSFETETELCAQLRAWNRQLCDKGLFLMTLRRSESDALVYVCRKSHLQRDLKQPGVAGLLSQYGYEKTDAGYALVQLKKRLQAESDGGFPHEIGIFLGYPLDDVIGFIENSGKNSKLSGCWKVYCNEQEAKKQFARIQKCRETYARLWKMGRTVRQLTVAA